VLLQRNHRWVVLVTGAERWRVLVGAGAGVAPAVLLNIYCCFLIASGRMTSARGIAASAFACGVLVLASNRLGLTPGASAPAESTGKARFLVGLACALSVLMTGWLRQGVTASSALAATYGLFGLAVHGCVSRSWCLYSLRQAPAGPISSFRLACLALPFLLGFFAASTRQSLQVALLSAAFAFAFKLEVTEPRGTAPPTSRSFRLSDGLLAALFFSTFEDLFFGWGTELLFPSWLSLFVSFVLAGAVVVIAAVCVARSRGCCPLLALNLRFGRGAMATARAVALWSLPAIVSVLLYQQLARRVGWFADWVQAQAVVGELPSQSERVGNFVLAVLLAPIFEEIIFRGMIFRGLRRGAPLLPAVLLSSLLFASVHPLTSAPSVFIVALCSAMALEASGSLLAAILIHSIYNCSAMFL